MKNMCTKEEVREILDHLNVTLVLQGKPVMPSALEEIKGMFGFMYAEQDGAVSGRCADYVPGELKEPFEKLAEMWNDYRIASEGTDAEALGFTLICAYTQFVACLRRFTAWATASGTCIPRSSDWKEREEEERKNYIYARLNGLKDELKELRHVCELTGGGIESCMATVCELFDK